MVAKLYLNYSDNNVVNKNKSLIGELNIRLLDDTNKINPVLILENYNSINFNYCEIPEFGRVYFCEKPIILTNNIMQVQCKCDVLSSHFNKILELSAIVQRSEFEGDTYLMDADLPIKTCSRVQTKEFPNGFSNETDYYMTIIGAKVTQ